MKGYKKVLVRLRKIIRFLGRKMDTAINGKETATPEEKILREIVEEILVAPDLVKVTPRTGEIYLATQNCYVKLNGNKLWIVTESESVVKDCSSEFGYHIGRLVDKCVEKDARLLDKKVFTNEIKLLEKIKQSE